MGLCEHDQPQHGARDQTRAGNLGKDREAVEQKRRRRDDGGPAEPRRGRLSRDTESDQPDERTDDRRQQDVGRLGATVSEQRKSRRDHD